MVQIAYPLMAGGANKVSLYEAQQEFIKSGVSEFRFIRNVRKPMPSDRRELHWRPFNLSSDPHLSWDSEVDHEHRRASGFDACLYYWREDYWLSPKRPPGNPPS